MKHSKMLRFSILGCLLLMAAQAPAAGSPVIHTFDQSGFPEVEMTFSLWNENGLPFTDLFASDVTLQEDGGSPFHPASLSLETKADVAVMLVLDVSGSMSGKDLEQATSAAKQLLARLEKSDQAGLIAFSDDVNPDPAVRDFDREVDFNHDFSELYDRLDAVRAEGGTELYNALEKAVRMTTDLPEGHRAVLLLSDGKNDPANVGDRQAAIELARENNIPIFVIGLGDAIDETYLKEAAALTGGVYKATPGSAELAELFLNMAGLLKTIYRATYTSQLPADGAEHTLQLSISAEGKDWTTTQGIRTVKIEAEPSGQDAEPVSAADTTAASEDANLVDDTPGNRLGLLLALVITVLVLAGLGALRLLRNRRKKAVTKCAKCGHPLGGESICPVCGAEQKIKR